MQYVKITDLYGIPIIPNTEHPFILIHSSQPHLLLIKIGQMSDDSIWRLKHSTCMHVLYKNGVNPGQFAPLGDIWFPQPTLPNQVSILLVNTDARVSKATSSYKEVAKYKGLILWAPEEDDEHAPIGLIASPTQPPPNYTRVVKKHLLTPSVANRIVNGGITNFTGFSQLYHISLPKLTIDRTKFIANEKTLIVRSGNSNFLGASDKPIKFTFAGEMRIDDMCYTVNSDNSVSLQKCQGTVNQQWYPFQHGIKSVPTDLSLTEIPNIPRQLPNPEIGFPNPEIEEIPKGVLAVTPYTGNKNQLWFMTDTHNVIEDKDQEGIETWRDKEGKRVIVIDPDYPWKINDTSHRNPEGLIKNKITKLNQVNYTPYADYNTNFMMDTTRPDMGYGYSYKDRIGKRCMVADKCGNTPIVPKDRFILEHFDGEQIPKISKLSWILLIISIIILLIHLEIY